MNVAQLVRLSSEDHKAMCPTPHSPQSSLSKLGSFETLLTSKVFKKKERGYINVLY